MPSSIRSATTTGAAATVMAILTYALGDWSPAMSSLLIFMALDYVTGFWLAWREGKLSSKVGFTGLGKKIMILALVAIGHRLDLVFATDLFRNAFAFFYMANELLSITENAAALGVPIPKRLVQAIKELKAQSGEDEKEAASDD